MFGIAFITGAIKAERITTLTIIVFISLSLFLAAKTPVSGFLKRRERSVLYSMGIFLLTGSFGCLYSALKQPWLIFLYAAGMILLILYFVLLRKGFPFISEACGMAIMGLVASIAASTAGETASAFYPGLMFFSFYLASSFRVRFAIARYRLISGIYSGIALLVSIIMVSAGRLIFLSFLPLTEDFYSSIKGKKESFKSLGIISTIKAIVFALLLIALN